MTAKDCAGCRYECGSWVKVGDCDYGNHEWWPECSCEDPRMEEWDGDGDCPCYEEADE